MRGAALALLLLCACRSAPAASAANIRGPDGKDNWIAITCEGAQVACVAEAGKLCPGGWDEMERDGRTLQESRAVATGDFASAHSSETYHGELLVRCKGAARLLDTRRECMGDGSCGLGERCVWPHGAGFFDRGRCARSD